MEKLQKALEKARSTRIARQARAHGVSPRDHAPAPTWNALPDLEIVPETLVANRVVTLHSGADSTHYDMLRTRVRDIARRNNYRRVAVVSPDPRAGKSTTVANLAFSFGRLPTFKTMVFDFDLRRPRLQEILGQKPTSNMGAVISGHAEFDSIARRHGANLAFALNDGPVAHSAELLQSDRIEDLLNAIEQTYTPDLMLFDMPPFLVADDAHGFIQHVDAVILVIEAEVATLSQVDLVEQKLGELTKVMGVVLNKCNFPDANDSSGYNYY